ncbi:MAG: hypothetical protein ACK51N_03030, partial [bacterium]
GMDNGSPPNTTAPGFMELTAGDGAGSGGEVGFCAGDAAVGKVTCAQPKGEMVEKAAKKARAIARNRVAFMV